MNSKTLPHYTDQQAMHDTLAAQCHAQRLHTSSVMGVLASTFFRSISISSSMLMAFLASNSSSSFI